MGVAAFISKLLSFTRVERNGAKYAEAKFDPGGGANLTGEHFAAPGNDGAPLPGDTLLAVKIRRSGGLVVVGYIDTANAGKAGAGEARTYARNAAGAEVCEVWLKADGSVLIDNAAGKIELSASGSVDLNGVIIDPAGNISAPGNIAADLEVIAGNAVPAAAVKLKTHTHTGVTPGPGASGPPTPGT